MKAILVTVSSLLLMSCATSMKQVSSLRTPMPARDAALGTWQPLGPGNIGGRTRSFIVRPDDPNTMYAGAVGGGVWKTTDGGASWNPLSDLLPSIGVTALAMDPTAPDTVYAGTGE